MKDIEITEEEMDVTVKTKIYTWKCPITGVEVRKAIRPCHELDFLSPLGIEIHEKKKEKEEIERKQNLLEKFRNEYSNFIGSKIVDLLHDREYAYIQGIVVEGKDGNRYKLEYDYDYDDSDDSTFHFVKIG